MGIATLLKQNSAKLRWKSEKSDTLDSFRSEYPYNCTTNPKKGIQFTSTCKAISSKLNGVKRQSRRLISSCWGCDFTDSSKNSSEKDLDWKPKHMDPSVIDRIVRDGLGYREYFIIRANEIDANRTTSIETTMYHQQETAINHVKTAGLLYGDFGSTPEMCKRNLIWVVSKMQVLVDRYTTRGDVVQVDTWVAAYRKNGMRRDWLVRDGQTGEILSRASSIWVMMNKETRRLAKMPDEVRAEISGYFVDLPPVVDEDSRKLPKLDDKSADYIRSGLTPRWNELDVNQHVNNVKYFGWILESAPVSLLESHEIAAMTLEYKKECLKDNVVQSLTSVLGNDVGNLANAGFVECQHSLRLEGGAEILKGRTEWRPKYAKRIGTVGELPAERA